MAASESDDGNNSIFSSGSEEELTMSQADSITMAAILFNAHSNADFEDSKKLLLGGKKKASTPIPTGSENSERPGPSRPAKVRSQSHKEKGQTLGPNETITLDRPLRSGTYGGYAPPSPAPARPSEKYYEGANWDGDGVLSAAPGAAPIQAYRSLGSYVSYSSPSGASTKLNYTPSDTFTTSYGPSTAYGNTAFNPYSSSGGYGNYGPTTSTTYAPSTSVNQSFQSPAAAAYLASRSYSGYTHHSAPSYPATTNTSFLSTTAGGYGNTTYTSPYTASTGTTAYSPPTTHYSSTTAPYTSSTTAGATYTSTGAPYTSTAPYSSATTTYTGATPVPYSSATTASYATSTPFSAPATAYQAPQTFQTPATFGTGGGYSSPAYAPPAPSYGAGALGIGMVALNSGGGGYGSYQSSGGAYDLGGTTDGGYAATVDGASWGGGYGGGSAGAGGFDGYSSSGRYSNSMNGWSTPFGSGTYGSSLTGYGRGLPSYNRFGNYGY